MSKQETFQQVGDYSESRTVDNDAGIVNRINVDDLVNYADGDIATFNYLFERVKENVISGNKYNTMEYNCDMLLEYKAKLESWLKEIEDCRARINNHSLCVDEVEKNLLLLLVNSEDIRTDIIDGQEIHSLRGRFQPLGYANKCRCQNCR